MLEFNIQPQAGGWFTFPENVGYERYQPLDYPSKILEGRDVCYIEVCGCEISFSYEMHGIHVVFESDIITEEKAFAIVTSISHRLANITGQPTVVYES
ncbi:hypothetical protein NIES21_15970 [Anabaenopsis circularis NIES-21]|uniref:Uncharacterized protein n=1 Tax=Anabaenopsis circularis NIES-21 TaxID=1085406 RepID=A0A1Z4GEL2_9CYAN|nr:hypothetical protein NIES21_15970 [Anabaenopsis circularis NIES-21]